MMQIMPELQEMFGKAASLKVGSIGTFVAEDIIEVVAPAMQIVPELQDHCGEPSLVIPKEMDLLGASTVPVTPLLEPSLVLLCGPWSLGIYCHSLAYDHWAGSVFE
jgi:hypothetical protein